MAVFTKLTTDAPEKGTFPVDLAFTDENGDAVSPDTLTWTLTDMDGTVINSREDVAVSSPSSSETITLSGDDLALSSEDSEYEERMLIIKGTYTSDLGSGLPLRGGVIFSVVKVESWIQ